MALFPTAPRIVVRLPRVLHAGQSVVVHVEIVARRDVRLDWIRARLETTAAWEGRAAETTGTSRAPLLSLRAELFAGGVLEAGTHAHRVRFDLPADLPASMAIGSARVETLLHVEASIPWWPDARASYVIPVRAAPEEIRSAPLRAANGASGGDVPRVELSLASRVVAARGVIAGAVACFHHDPRALRGTSLALRGAVKLGAADGGVTAYTIALPSEIPADGTPVPFRARVPDTAIPRFRARGLALDWELRVERHHALTTSTWLAVPIEIVEAGEGDDAAAGLEVPPIGDARLAGVLASAARASGLAIDGDALAGASGAVRFRVRRTIDPGVGNSLLAELELPRLGLGLVVTRTRLLTSLLPGDVEVGHRAFDDAHRVEARDADQARAFLSGLAELLADGSLRTLDDARAVLVQPDPTLDERSIVAFAWRVRQVAAALDGAIAQIVPPTAVTADVQAWHDVARTLQARAVIGDLSIEGRSGESEVTIETSLGAREHTIRVRPSPAIPDDVEISVADARAAPLKALAAALSALPERARDLEIARGEARLRLPLELDGERPRSDPGAALRAATVLARLGSLLAPARGPFR